VTGCRIRTNLSRFSGGGISNEGRSDYGAVLTLTNSTVSGNEVSNGSGGGVYVLGAGPTPTASLPWSAADGEDGEVHTESKAAAETFASVRLINSSISGNSAMYGGGIACVDSSKVELGYSTVSGNEAVQVGEWGGIGGGFHNDDGAISLKGSLIAGNTAPVGADCYSTDGLTSEGYNLIGESDGCDWPVHPGDLMNVSPLLGPLQDNGGSTKTHALLLGSPAQDVIPEPSCTDLSGVPVLQDQRGVSRPQGIRCDIGSFEAPAMSADLSLIKTVSPVLAYEGTPVVFSILVANGGPLQATGVVVRDELPIGLNFVSSEASLGEYDVQTGLWSVGGVQLGSTPTLTITTRVEPGAVGTALSNLASIVVADQPDPVPENNSSVVSVTIAELLAVYVPSVFNQYVALPIYVGNAIPSRLTDYQGEVFYTTTVRLPDELPQGGAFYFSSQPHAAADALVDDELVVWLDGQQVFVFDFSTSGYPTPSRVQVPRTTMEQLAGETVEIVYRDRYAALISASEMWLIWVP